MKTKTLLACGIIGGPVFVLAFLVEGATRVNYEPLRHPVSSLALGDSGWTQTANFIITGLLTLAFAAGLWHTLRPGKGSVWGPLLVGVWAVGLLGAGVFVTDPVSGYPPGTPTDSPGTVGTAPSTTSSRYSASWRWQRPASCSAVGSPSRASVGGRSTRLLVVSSSRSRSSSPVRASHRSQVWWIWPDYSSVSRSPSASVG